MELDITHALTELQTFTDALKTYHADVAAYLADPSLTPPNFLGISVSSIDTLTAALLTQKMSANAVGGYLVDAVHHMGAIQREQSMRYSSKSSYYITGSDDSLNESNYYDNMNAEYAQGYRGNLLI